MTRFPLSILSFSVGLALSTSAWSAATTTDAKKAVEGAYKLATVKVVERNTPGEVVLDHASIETMPTATGSLTDLLRGQSSIQFEAGSRASANQADIASPLISIMGSTPTESTYLIDGLNNNNVYNATGYGTSVSLVAFGTPPVGNPEGLMLTDGLLESLEVYETDIPVSFGRFAGGVVDAKLRKPKSDKWHGSVTASYTDNNLTHQLWTPDESEDDEVSSQSGDVRTFKRGSVGATLEGPLGSSGLVGFVGVSRQFSVYDTYTRLKDAPRKNHRTNDNLMLRVATDTGSNWDATATLLYAPYKAQYYAMVMKDGEWKNSGGGLRGQLNVKHRSRFGVFNVDASLSQTDLKRDAHGINKSYQWLNVPGGKHVDWTTASRGNEGLMGDMTFTDRSVALKPVFSFEPIGDKVRHKIDVGLELNYSKLKMDKQENTAYSSPTKAPNVVGELKDGIVEGEQYAAMIVRYAGGTIKRNSWNVAAFVSDTITVDRFTVRPGLRIARENLLKDTTFSPRLFVDADVLDDDRFHVHGGAARYWAAGAFTKAFDMGIDVTRTMRALKGNEVVNLRDIPINRPTDWHGLKTPFTNEFTLGGSALFSVGKFSGQYTHRDYKDQFSTRFEGGQVTFTNEGRSTYRGLSLKFESGFDAGKAGQHRFSVGLTRSDTKGNNPNRFSIGDDMLGDDVHILLDGKLVPITDLPASSFNTPWILAYDHEARFLDDRLKAHLTMRWQSASSKLLRVKNETYEGIKYPTYVTKHRNHWFNADLGLEANVYRHGDHRLNLNVDVLNLFDNKNIVSEGKEDGVYSTGTQFILGMKYTF